MNGFPRNKKKINFIVIFVLEKSGLIVQVWAINSRYGGTYFWAIFFRKWEHKKMVSPHSRANLDFGGVRGEEEYCPKLPVRSL